MYGSCWAGNAMTHPRRSKPSTISTGTSCAVAEPVLPSVKCSRRARGLERRRVYDGPRTPFERVRACPQADGAHVAQLEERRKRLDPFQLARTIDRKLDRIYRLANRRLSPKEVQETATSRRGKGDDGGAPVHIKWLDDHR